ncbi:MAG: hypothetical protein KAR38_11855 [Calditrichia bacterium]|nr:hypothetical protein [Calditrichia bacterium]
MALDINIIQHNDYLEIVVTGSYDMNDTIDKFSHVLDICRHTGLAKVLIDFRELQGQGSGTEKSLYAFGIEDLYLKYLNSGGHELKVAYVSLVVSSYEPGVEIAKETELPFKLFDKQKDAFEWLNVKNK